jgi:hypothetical protein
MYDRKACSPPRLFLKAQRLDWAPCFRIRVTRQWLDSFRELWLGRLAILLMPYKWAVNALAEPGLMF